MRTMMYWIVAGLVGVSAFATGRVASGTVLDAPTVTAINPAAAQPGKSVTITGTALTGATVSFQKAHSKVPPVTATQAETIVSSTGDRILVTVPDGSDAANGMTAPIGVDRLVIATPGGSWTSHFRVLPLRQIGRAPAISGVRPLRVSAGRTLTITGSHLSGATGVWLAGKKATFRVPSDSKILVLVPRNARSGHLSVRTAVGKTVSTMRITVVARGM